MFAGECQTLAADDKDCNSKKILKQKCKRVWSFVSNLQIRDNATQPAFKICFEFFFESLPMQHLTSISWEQRQGIKTNCTKGTLVEKLVPMAHFLLLRTSITAVPWTYTLKYSLFADVEIVHWRPVGMCSKSPIKCFAWRFQIRIIHTWTPWKRLECDRFRNCACGFGQLNMPLEQ